MRVLLSLDFSTSATGYAKFCLDTGKLITYGVIEPDFKNPKKKGLPSYIYPEAQTLKLRRLAEQIIELIDENVTRIVIEEVNRGKSRLTQKILDGGHFIFLEKLNPDLIKIVKYYDSDGSDGWRSKNGLKLQLSDADKNLNKENKKLNKKLAKGEKKLPIITQKTLACRFVNKKFKLNLDDEKNSTDADIADAIGLGVFYLEKVINA